VYSTDFPFILHCISRYYHKVPYRLKRLPLKLHVQLIVSSFIVYLKIYRRNCHKTSKRETKRRLTVAATMNYDLHSALFYLLTPDHIIINYESIVCVPSPLIVTRNVMVDWLTLILTIREVPGSRQVLDTNYPDMVSWFSSVPSGICLNSFLN
jgi:hypothetical protein